MPQLSPEVMAMIASYGPIIFLGVFFYFMLYRPQKKEQQRRKEMLNNLKKGDRIITMGGIYGTITGISEKVVTIKVADKVEIDVLRTAVSSYQNEPKK